MRITGSCAPPANSSLSLVVHRLELTTYILEFTTPCGSSQCFHPFQAQATAALPTHLSHIMHFLVNTLYELVHLCIRN